MADEPSPIVLAASVSPAEGRQSLRVGYLYAAIGALLFSSKGIVIKLAYDEGLDAETLLGIRLGLALPVYLAIGALSLRDRARQGRSLPSLRLSLGAALVGILGYFVASYSDFLGLQFISAQFERLILFTFPAFVVLFGAWFFGQPIRRNVVVAIAIAYAGLAIIFTSRLQTIGADVVVGVGFVLVAAIAFAFYQLLAKPLIGQVGPRLFTCIAMSSAAIVAIVQFLVTHSVADLDIGATAFWYAVLLAVGATIIPSFLLAAALHRISAQANATIGMVSPVATIVLAWLILGETLNATDFLGVALVLAGVGAMTLRGGERPAAGEPRGAAN